jgi:hypothetical protein
MVRVDGYACPTCKKTSYYLHPEQVRTCYLVGNELFLKCPDGKAGIIREITASVLFDLQLPPSTQIHIPFVSPLHNKELPSETFSYNVRHEFLDRIKQGCHSVACRVLEDVENLAQRNHQCVKMRRKSI